MIKNMGEGLTEALILISGSKNEPSVSISFTFLRPTYVG